MVIYYVLFIITYFITVLGTYENKKYQMTAGTGLYATIVYMIINGIVSALVSFLVLLGNGETFEITVYSLLFALATVVCAAGSTVATFKAYEKGKMSVVTTFAAIGSIIISCTYGMVFLKEQLTMVQTASVALMVIAVVIVLFQNKVKADKSILGLLFAAVIASGLVSILGKQHQVEQGYKTVNTLSYSIWVGVIRTLFFSVLLCVVRIKGKRGALQLTKKTVGCATAASVFSGLAYILSLTVLKVLPITIVSTFGTALNISLTAVMARVAYKEKLSKRQIAGIVLCMIGIFLFTGVSK